MKTFDVIRIKLKSNHNHRGDPVIQVPHCLYVLVGCVWCIALSVPMAVWCSSMSCLHGFIVVLPAQCAIAWMCLLSVCCRYCISMPEPQGVPYSDTRALEIICLPGIYQDPMAAVCSSVGSPGFSRLALISTSHM